MKLKRFFPFRRLSVISHLYQYYFFWQVAATMRCFPWLRIQEDPLPTAKLLVASRTNCQTVVKKYWPHNSVFIFCLGHLHASQPQDTPSALPRCLFSRSTALLSIPGLRAPNSTWQSQICWT